jgi:CMP-N-acetylneuraminic acid synthetase
VDLFVLTNVGGVEQVFIDGAGAFIVQFALKNDAKVLTCRNHTVTAPSKLS